MCCGMLNIILLFSVWRFWWALVHLDSENLAGKCPPRGFVLLHLSARPILDMRFTALTNTHLLPYRLRSAGRSQRLRFANTVLLSRYSFALPVDRESPRGRSLRMTTAATMTRTYFGAPQAFLKGNATMNVPVVTVHRQLPAGAVPLLFSSFWHRRLRGAIG
jgi:uncharacterized protein YceK